MSRPSSAGYHKYVFDVQQRTFVGKFEEMYQAEETEGFDSWHERDLRHLRKTISRTILDAYSFGRILDLGCGKGLFTQFLKKQNNHVVGIDVSPTAIRKARESFADIDFRCMSIESLATLEQTFDLAVVMGTFAYVADWPRVIDVLATMTRYFYVAEYIPRPDPIGFVKSPDRLISEVARHFVIRTKVLLDDEHCLLLAEVR
jgi:2-polyprenyl-3-methyl-5-hydroxy-6-metoxy-1,4-benzoquinol methylase